MVTMKHLFVPYEIALKLKEKGFDEPCLRAYCEKYEIEPKTGADIKTGMFYLTDTPRAKTIRCKAPLYQQVIDWFREKHNIDIFINAHYKTDNSIAGYLFDVYDRREKYDTHKGCFESPNYYEALNKAIEEVLKLI